MKFYKVSKEHSRRIIEQLIPIINSDKKITVEEMDELYQLFLMFDFKQEERMEMLLELIQNRQISPEITIPEKLTLGEKIILAKELIKFRDLQKANTPEVHRIINKMVEMLKLKSRVLTSLISIINIEREVLKKWKDTDDINDLVPNLEELATYGVSIGLPLTLLSLFGIGGLSAVGVTSGLAAIGGLIGTFGFSPMIGGLIVLFIVAISSNRLMKKVIIPFMKKHSPDLLKKILLRKKVILRICNNITACLTEDISTLRQSGLFQKYFFKKRKLAGILKELTGIYIKRKEDIEKADIKEGKK